MNALNFGNLKNTIPFFVLIVSQLHLLRNVSSIYFVFLIFTFFLSTWFVVSNWHAMCSAEKSLLFIVLAIYFWPIFAALPSVFNGTYSSFSDVGIGVARVMFSLPIYLVVLACSSNKEYLFKLLKIAALIALLAALSIPYQFVFGAIYWFADNAERSGLLRFASLFGSLTALGIVCGYGILLAAISIKSPLYKTIVISGIVLGSVLSLQKAAIVNILIAFAAVLVIQKPNLKSIFKSTFIFLPVAGFIGIYFFEEMNQYLSSIRIGSDSSASSFSDDVSISGGIVERLVELPAIAINYHGMESLLFGLGPIGGSGAFGYAEIPMSHNGMVDILLIGGVPYLLIMLALFFFVLKISANKVGDEDLRKIRYSGLVIFIVSLVNMTFSGLLIFAPSNAMFLAIALKCVAGTGRR